MQASLDETLPPSAPTGGVLRHLLAAVREDAPVRDLALGPRAAAVWTRGLGVTSLCPQPAAAALEQARELLARERPASGLALAALATRPEPALAALGVAALNSLLEVEPARLVPGSGQSLLAQLGADRDVTVVGH